MVSFNVASSKDTNRFIENDINNCKLPSEEISSFADNTNQLFEKIRSLTKKADNLISLNLFPLTEFNGDLLVTMICAQIQTES